MEFLGFEEKSEYVESDLKADTHTHQDLGQMQMYVNYYDREVCTEFENPTIGILLCKVNKEAMIKLTLQILLL